MYLSLFSSLSLSHLFYDGFLPSNLCLYQIQLWDSGSINLDWHAGSIHHWSVIFIMYFYDVRNRGLPKQKYITGL